MRRIARGPVSSTGTPIRPRQRMIAGAAFLAVAGLGASYLQALRSPSAYAATDCSVSGSTEISSLASFITALGDVNAGTCDTITFSPSTQMFMQSAGQIPAVDLESLPGAQHLTITGSDTQLYATNSAGYRGLEIHLGHDDALTITGFSGSGGNATTTSNPNGGLLSVMGEVYVGDKAEVTVSTGLWGGYDAVKGGAMYFSNVDALVEYVQFTNARSNPDSGSSVGGGAIYAIDSNLSIEKVIFIEGVAKTGGALFVRNGSLTVDEGNFYSNLSRRAGAGIYVDNADVLVSNSSFQENDSSSDSNLTNDPGGALYVKNASVQVHFSSFVDNATLGQTSGIHIDSPYDTVTMKGVLIGTSTDTDPNCTINPLYAATPMVASYSVSDDASCDFETFDTATPTNSKDNETTLVTSSDMNVTNGGDNWAICGPRWLRSRMPKATSWAVVNAPTSHLGTGVTDDIWEVPRSGTFTIGARQWIDPPTITSPTTDSFPDGTTGVTYTSQTVTASNGPHIFYDLPRPWPAGMSFNQCTGVFAGRPTQAGSYTVRPTASGPGGTTSVVAQNYVIVQGPMAPSITAGPTTTGQLGVPYSSSFTATGYPAPTFSLALGSGPVPPGLTLNSDGTLTGTPTQEGTFTFTAKAANATNPFATRQATITIGKVPPTFTRESAPGSATFGTAYSYSFGASGTAPITFAKASGTIPPGLTLNASTGALTGTPTTPGTYTFTVSATNGAGSDTSVSQTITVAGAEPLPPVVGAKGGDTVLNLSWPKQTRQGSSPITKYKVVITPGNKSCEVNATSAATYSCQITGLKNGTPYTVKAQSFSAEGWSTVRTTGPVTPFTVPGKPTKLTVESKAANGTMKISWEPPSSNGGSAIQGYVVFWRLEDDTKLNQMPMVSVLNRTITGLKPGARYRVSVSAKNAAGRGDTTFISNIRIPKS